MNKFFGKLLAGLPEDVRFRNYSDRIDRIRVTFYNAYGQITMNYSCRAADAPDHEIQRMAREVSEALNKFKEEKI